MFCCVATIHADPNFFIVPWKIWISGLLVKFPPNPSWPMLGAVCGACLQVPGGWLSAVEFKETGDNGSKLCSSVPWGLWCYRFWCRLVTPVIYWECWKSFPEEWAISSTTAPSDQPEFGPLDSDAHTSPQCVGLCFCHPLAPLETQCRCPTLPSKVWKYSMRWYRHELWGWVPWASHHWEFEPLPSRRRCGGTLFCELSALINLFKY